MYSSERMSVLVPTSLNIPIPKPVPLETSPCNTKIVMRKIQPIVPEDDSPELDLEEDEEGLYTQASRRLNEEEYDLMEENEEEEV